MNHTFVAVFASLLVASSIFLIWRLWNARRRTISITIDSEREKVDVADPYEDIEPLPSFNWSETKPMQIRVFKPKFYLTMALENCPLSEYLAVDHTYLDRMKFRQSVMDQHPEATYQCSEPCEAAVAEMYEWMFGTYLPKRFPTMFKIVSSNELPSDSKAEGPCLHNIPANEYIPLKAPLGKEALYTLGRHVDDDILILLPLTTAEDGSPIYHLQAYVCCCPSGFSLPQKFGLPLASIHTPVPGYKAKLEKSMDRYFAKLETGKAVRRYNWAITTNTNLFSVAGNHLYEGGKTGADHSGKDENTLNVDSAEMEESIKQQKRDVKIENCRLRSERQTVHRLQKTKAIVFAFKTYQYKLNDIKAEGSGPALAEAIEGLKLGNVPDMAYYKRGVVWGDKVREYLLS